MRFSAFPFIPKLAITIIEAVGHPQMAPTIRLKHHFIVKPLKRIDGAVLIWHLCSPNIGTRLSTCRKSIGHSHLERLSEDSLRAEIQDARRSELTCCCLKLLRNLPGASPTLKMVCGKQRIEMASLATPYTPQLWKFPRCFSGTSYCTQQRL